MKVRRLPFALTVINLGLLVFLLAQTRIQIGSYGVRVWTNIDGSVLRGRALEIVDSQGRIRASINSGPGWLDKTGGPLRSSKLQSAGEGSRSWATLRARTFS